MPASQYNVVNRAEWFHKLLFVEDCAVQQFIVPDKERIVRVEEWKRGSADGDHGRPWIGIHVNTARNKASFPPEYVVEMVLLFSKRWNVVLLGSWVHPALLEVSGEHVFNLIDKTGIADLIALCSLMDFIIAPDSSVLHIAGTLGIKGIGVLGNMKPDTRCKYYPTLRILHPAGAMGCIPCQDMGDCDLRGKVGALCMRLITPMMIYEAVEEEARNEPLAPVSDNRDA
jgi:ADP-heptose:LPS heptosyltransferase